MISPPPNQKPLQVNNIPERTWVAFFSEVYKIIASIQGSGTTANRPTSFLWVGRPYFDTTLGFPVWHNGTTWVRYDGTPA